MSGAKKKILVTGEMPEWDAGPFEQVYDAVKLYEADDRMALLRTIGAEMDGIAVCGN